MVSGEQPNGQKPKKVKKLNKNETWLWPFKFLIISFALSMFFGVSSELLLSNAGIIISIVIIIFFMSISVLTDTIGVALTCCNIQPFRAMASRKVRGAKESIRLLDNVDKVSVICSDVIGDVCGILSGAAGATIIVKFAISPDATALSIIVASLISSLIASFTIFGKALGKKYAIKNCNKVVLVVGKMLSVFSGREKKSKAIKLEKTETQDINSEDIENK